MKACFLYRKTPVLVLFLLTRGLAASADTASFQVTGTSPGDNGNPAQAVSATAQFTVDVGGTIMVTLNNNLPTGTQDKNGLVTAVFFDISGTPQSDLSGPTGTAASTLVTGVSLDGSTEFT